MFGSFFKAGAGGSAFCLVSISSIFCNARRCSWAAVTRAILWLFGIGILNPKILTHSKDLVNDSLSVDTKLGPPFV